MNLSVQDAHKGNANYIKEIKCQPKENMLDQYKSIV